MSPVIGQHAIVLWQGKAHVGVVKDYGEDFIQVDIKVAAPKYAPDNVALLPLRRMR